MASALSYPASTAGLAWAVGGRPELGAAIGLAYAAALTWARLPPTVPPPPKGAGIVISGASSGIGRAAAEELASLGFTVFAGVRKLTDGEPLKAAGCTPIILDICDEASIAAAAAFHSLLPVDSLVPASQAFARSTFHSLPQPAA